MNGNPLISIIVPVYHAEEYLEDCLDSLLGQTYPNFELLVIEDGSPDHCWEIMQRYAERDERIRVFRKPNGGVSSTRNFGLQQAKGDYIGFVDSDDMVVPQYLERMDAAMVEQDTRLAVCRLRHVPTKEMKSRCSEPVPKAAVHRITTDTYVYGGVGTCSRCIGVLFQRALLEDIRFDPELAIGEDSLFFLQAFLKAGSFSFCDEPLYLYGVRADSSYRKAFTMKQYTEVQAWERILELVQDQPEPFRKSTEGLLLSACARVYYRMRDADCAPELRKKLWKEARAHRRAFPDMPIRNIWEKGRVWTMLYCPHVGAKVWNHARKIQSRMKNKGSNSTAKTYDLGKSD